MTNQQPHRIKIEIEVPQSGPPLSEIRLSFQERGSTSGRNVLRRPNDTIELPTADSQPPARLNAANKYVICAKGTTDASVVKAQVVLGNPTPTQPDTPPAGAIPADIALGNWIINELPVAALGRKNALFIWFIHTDTTNIPDPILKFTPIEAVKTECEA